MANVISTIVIWTTLYQYLIKGAGGEMSKKRLKDDSKAKYFILYSPFEHDISYIGCIQRVRET